MCVERLREGPPMAHSLGQQKRRAARHGNFCLPWADKFSSLYSTLLPFYISLVFCLFTTSISLPLCCHFLFSHEFPLVSPAASHLSTCLQMTSVQRITCWLFQVYQFMILYMSIKLHFFQPSQTSNRRHFVAGLIRKCVIYKSNILES